MEFWMLYTMVAVVAVVIEIFFPTMFCINFAIAAIITAILSLVWGSAIHLFWVFIILSAILLLYVKPLLQGLMPKGTNRDFDNQYKGKVVKVISTITKDKGAITIYEERWEARLLPDSEETEIPEGSNAKIIYNDSTIFYVEKE